MVVISYRKIALYLFLLVLFSRGSIQTNTKQREFLVLSDIHTDLLYNSNFGPNVFCRDPSLYDSSDCKEKDEDVQRNPFFDNKHGQLGCDLPIATVSAAFVFFIFKKGKLQ